MAMAPWFQQERLLHEALGKAARVLQAPIDRIELTEGKILFRAGTEEATISFKSSPIKYRSGRVLLPGDGPILWLDDGQSTRRFYTNRRRDRVQREENGKRQRPEISVVRTPWRQRQELLHATFFRFTDRHAMIDRLEVTSDKVLIWAFPVVPRAWPTPEPAPGVKEFTICYQHVSNPSQGFLLDGTFHWEFKLH